MCPEMGVEKVARIRVMTTTERDALEAVEGMVIFNSTTDQLEEYDGATWQAVGQVIMDTHEALTIAHGTVDDIADQTDIATHAADLDAHTKHLFEILRTGEYVFPFATRYSTSTGTLAANYMYTIPFFVPRTMTFDRITIEVTTEKAGKSCRLGIYNNGTNLAPGTLVVDAGEVSVATTGVKAATIDQQLTKGIYWLAVASEADPTIRLVSYMWVPAGRDAATITKHNNSYYIAHTYAALPDPFGTGTLQAATSDHGLVGVWLRLASLD